MSDRPASAPSPGAGTWPLVGRGQELERIARARSDRGCRGVVLSAGAGIGKSRLAREAHAAAERDGALVYWAQATSSAAAVPLGAFAGLLPADVRSDDALELLRRAAGALRDAANGRRVVLGVDDAQLLDAVSAALVLHLTTTESAFVLATVRSGAPCPDAIVSLWKDGGAERIELGPLDDEAIAAIVETSLGGPLEQAALRWVVDSSRGNVLYVQELVRGAVDAGALTRADGLWRLRSRPRVSATLLELVGERMGGLQAAERLPLELLALGEPLRLAELAALTSFDTLADAEALGMIVVDSPAAGGDVRLGHPLYGDVLRDELPVLRRLDLRLRLAATVQKREPLTPDDALRVARWLLDAGAPIPSALLLDAARAANLAGDPDLGAQLAEAAAADGAGLPAVLLLARAHAARKRFDDAETALAAVEGEVGADVAAIDYLEQRLQVLFWGLDRPRDAQALLERALSWSPDAAWRRRLEPLRLGFPAVLASSIETLQELLVHPELDADTRRMTERQLAVSLYFAGRTKAAYDLARRLRPSVPLNGYSDALALGIWRLIGSETGEDWVELDAYMTRTLLDGVRANDHEAAGQAAVSIGYTHFLRGQYHDAARWIAEADLHFDQQDTFGSLLHTRALRVGIDVFGGDAAAAATSLERLHETLEGRLPLSSQLPYVARAEGWAALARGDAAEAQRLLLEAAGTQAERPGYASQLVYEAMRAGAPAGAMAAEQARLVARCDARLVAAYAAHAAALAARDGVALLEVAEEMAAIGALRYGMEAAAQAATTFLDAGRQDSARRAATRARELHVPDQGADPPRIDGLDAAAVALTAREHQIVTLASRGLGNAEIADQLVLSVRTVESHVYRAMQKLGAKDRREL